jgi:hypothetical protein
MGKTVFWADNIEVLWKDMFDIIPRKDGLLIDRLNSIVRLSIFVGIILSIFTHTPSFLIIIPTTLLATYVYKREYIDKTVEKFTDFEDPMEHRVSTSVGGSSVRPNATVVDYNGLFYEPTGDNPYMNILVNEIIDNPKRPPACKTMNKRLDRALSKYFKEKLFYDIGDVFAKTQGQRAFITQPVTTIPNDQESFAKWVYGVEKTCKEGNYNSCYRQSGDRGYSTYLDKDGKLVYN